MKGERREEAGGRAPLAGELVSRNTRGARQGQSGRLRALRELRAVDRASEPHDDRRLRSLRSGDAMSTAKKGRKWADGAGRSAKKPKACATCGRADGLHEIDCARRWRFPARPKKSAKPDTIDADFDVCPDCGASEKTHKPGCAWAATHRGHFESLFQAPFIVTRHVVGAEPLKIEPPPNCYGQSYQIVAVPQPMGAAGFASLIVVWVLKPGALL